MQFSPRKVKIDKRAAEGKVITQANIIGFISFQLASRFTKPIPRTAPTRICVLDTGKPIKVANITMVAEDSSAVNPDAGCILARLVPTV